MPIYLAAIYGHETEEMAAFCRLLALLRHFGEAVAEGVDDEFEPI